MYGVLLIFICIITVTTLNGNEVFKNKDNDGMPVR